MIIIIITLFILHSYPEIMVLYIVKKKKLDALPGYVRKGKKSNNLLIRSMK